MHPRSNVRFSALFLDKEEKSSFYRQILSLLWFFRKVFVQNLVVPWNFEWKSNWTQKFDKIFTQSMTLIVYENIYALTSVIDWGGEWFLKILCIIKTPHTSYIKPCNKMICDGYVSEWVNFQRVFVKTSNILITLQIWHITTSLTDWGGARKSSFYQKILKLTAFLSQKLSKLFKSIEIKNLERFEIFDRGRECDLNMKSDNQKWSFGLNKCAPTYVLNTFEYRCTYWGGAKGVCGSYTKDRPFIFMHGVIRLVKVRYEFPWSTRTGRIFPGTIHR